MRSVWELAAGAVVYLSTFGGQGTGREKTMIKSEWPGRLATESLSSMRETMRHRAQLCSSTRFLGGVASKAVSLFLASISPSLKWIRQCILHGPLRVSYNFIIHSLLALTLVCIQLVPLVLRISFTEGFLTCQASTRVIFRMLLKPLFQATMNHTTFKSRNALVHLVWPPYLTLKDDAIE